MQFVFLILDGGRGGDDGGWWGGGWWLEGLSVRRVEVEVVLVITVKSPDMNSTL